MKQKIFSGLILISLIFISQNSFAQQNFVYDGDTFNVWFKTNDANNQVVDVHFTADGQWNKFTIEDYQSLDNNNEGFAFKVKDGVGRYYWIDYYRDKDYIVVTDDKDGETWTLYRRKN